MRSKTTPDPRLRFDPEPLRVVEPERAFYRRKTVSVARDLVGAWFARRYDGAWYGARVVETEAYLGKDDPAAHTYLGRRTARVEPMYSDGGHLYVYFVYGMHHCINVVTRKEGLGQAVLLRAAEGPDGTPSRLLAGPGRFCKALGLTRDFTGVDLIGASELHLFRRPRRRVEICVAPRVGIDYAGEAKAWPLRFFDCRSPAVSRRWVTA